MSEIWPSRHRLVPVSAALAVPLLLLLLSACGGGPPPVEPAPTVIERVRLERVAPPAPLLAPVAVPPLPPAAVTNQDVWSWCLAVRTAALQCRARQQSVIDWLEAAPDPIPPGR